MRSQLKALAKGMHLLNSEDPHQACSQGSSGQFQFIQGFSSQMSVPPMNRMAPENPQPDLFNHINDSSMNLIPQNPAGPTTLKKHPKRTSFMQTQHEQLEALFSYTMFPDKNLQKELALKLNLPELTIKTWFRNRRVKLRKEQQQQQLSLKQPNQILPAKNVPTSLTSSPSPYSLFPVVPDSHSFLPPQPLGPSNLAQDSVITESPTSDVQMQDPQLEGLEASIPALFPDTYTIEKIMELHSFSDEDEIYDSFHCLYQYLSPTDPS
uniref:Arginine-fifty homeobox n=1 Tax=Molossus molossus TaxID=27622 RepID=A0A7J8HYM0_MOLMO|nr:arginine-fifty homeobox [Molossus molossus]